MERSVENAGWPTPDEGYWQALLEQGEIVPETVAASEPQEVLYSLIDESASTSRSATAAESPQAESSDKWVGARASLEKGDPFEVRAVSANRGGLLVEGSGLQGFVPASQLKEMPRTSDPQGRVAELARRVGELLTVRLIEVDEQQNRLVFSERAATASPEESPVQAINTLRPGDVRRGTIVNLTSFGAFVDLGGIEGLIHISEMSWDRLRHPSDVLKPGDEVQVYVLSVSPEEGRVALSLKRLRPSPWIDVDSRYQVGQIVEGNVTNVVSFGAFVRLEEGLEGLIHVSELADGGLMHPRNVVREGDHVQVRVLNIDAPRRRLGLSLRQVSNGREGTM